MNPFFTLRRATLLLALTLPGFSWGLPKTALVVTETGSPYQGDINAVVTFLSSRLTAASYAVTTSVGVPGTSMASYTQVWDIRVDTPLTGPDITAYVTYMAGGGALFAMGENIGCCGTRDTSLVALIAAAGGGVAAVAGDSSDTQTVHAPFTGPVSLTSLTYAAAGDYTAIGAGAFITTDTNTTGAAVIFGPGAMTNAASGALASVLDINFMDTSGGAQGLSQALTDNLISYLGAPTPVGGPTTFTFTGPAGGRINSASTNFTVTPSAAYTGTITITPSGGGLSAPIVLTFAASAAPQTFTITPTSIGPVLLTPTNSGSLTNPAALSYATPSSAPTIGTATPGMSAIVVAFTAPANNGGAAISLYTATCSPGNVSATGTSSPITVPGLSPGVPYSCSVTATNAGGVSAASAISNQVFPGLPGGSPAPSTLLLVLTGLFSVGYLVRRRQSRGEA